MKQNVIHKMRKGMMVLFTFFILQFSFFVKPFILKEEF